MKKLCLSLLAVGLLGGCATTPVKLSDAVKAPADRVLAYQTEEPGKTARLTVIRDSGMVGSGCYFAFYINKQLAARLDTAETATFKLEPGEVLLRMSRDPLGNSVCGMGADFWIQRETILRAGEEKTFRMLLDANGAMDVMRSDM